MANENTSTASEQAGPDETAAGGLMEEDQQFMSALCGCPQLQMDSGHSGLPQLVSPWRAREAVQLISKKAVSLRAWATQSQCFMSAYTASLSSALLFPRE